MNTVIGYKATYGDMSCGTRPTKLNLLTLCYESSYHYQYELGKTFVHDDELEMCSSGFHFCNQLQHVFLYYRAEHMKLFKIQASGNIIHSRNKSVCSEIQFVEQLDWYQIIDIVISQESITFNSCSENGLGMLLQLSPVQYKGDLLFWFFDVSNATDRLVLRNYIRKHCGENSYAYDEVSIIDDMDWEIQNLTNHNDYQVRRDLAKIGWNNEAYLTDKHNRVRTAASKYKRSLLDKREPI